MLRKKYKSINEIYCTLLNYMVFMFGLVMCPLINNSTQITSDSFIVLPLAAAMLISSGCTMKKNQ